MEFKSDEFVKTMVRKNISIKHLHICIKKYHGKPQHLSQYYTFEIVDNNDYPKTRLFSRVIGGYLITFNMTVIYDPRDSECKFVVYPVINNQTPLTEKQREINCDDDNYTLKKNSSIDIDLLINQHGTDIKLNYPPRYYLYNNQLQQ